jgi:hypothetical protein
LIMNAVEAMSEVSEGLRQLLISTIMDADVPQPSLNAWHPRGLESMMGFSIRLRRGAYAPNIDAEAVECDACTYKECHKPRRDPLQSMLTALSGSICHENSPGSRDVSEKRFSVA